MYVNYTVPSGQRLHNELENHHAINGKTHNQWPFSTASCIFTRPGNSCNLHGRAQGASQADPLSVSVPWEYNFLVRFTQGIFGNDPCHH